MVMRGRRIDRTYVKRNGREVDWERAIWGPARRRQQPNRLTPATGGDITGNLYETAVRLRLLITSTNVSQRFDMHGIWEEGNCIMTMPAHYKPGQWDQLTIVNWFVNYNSLHTKGASQGTDDIRYPKVDEIVRIVGQDGTAYTETTDYLLAGSDAAGWTVDWGQGGSEPTTGHTYTALLRVKPVWTVIAQPMTRGKSPGKVKQRPWRLVCRRFDQAVANV